MNSTDLLRRRRSTPSLLLGAPGPDEAQLLDLLQTAIRVPDHGRLTPWRFLRIPQEAGQALGERLVARHRERDPDAADSVLEKDRARFTQAPVVIAVIARITPGHKVPEVEQLLSGGAVCFQLLLAAEAAGFGGQWLTGWAAYDAEVARWLGLAEHERVLGFIHLGTPREAAPERNRPDARDLLSDWTP